MFQRLRLPSSLAFRLSLRSSRRLAALAGPVLVGLAGLLAAPARAADAAGDSDAEPVYTNLGEIVVTARRRDERLTDAPVAVTVETGEQLRDQEAVLFDDIAREVPNLRMMPSPQSVSALDITMRGQTAIRAAIDYDPAVGIYIDGVYVADGQAAMNTLLDIERVEIVRGAQGTLFGRDNTGGAISFQTTRPKLGEFSTEAEAQTGNDHMFSGRAIVNVPLADTLAVRMAYQDNERAGYGSSVATGEGDFENEHRFQARIGALWRPNPGFDAYWTYEHFEADEAGALLHPLHGTIVEQIGQAIPQILQADPLLTGIAPVVIPNNFYQTDADLLSHDHTHSDATQLTLNQVFAPDLRGSAILAYRHLANSTAIDVDATSLPFADTLLWNSSSQKSIELQLKGLSFERRLDWVAGLYAFRDDGNAPSEIPPQSASYQQLFTLISGPVVPYPVIESNSVENRSSAGFLHGEYHLTERWSVAAGLRRTDDVRKLDENEYAATPLGPQCTVVEASTGLPLDYPSPSPPCPPIDKSASFSYWSWEVSARYRVSEELNTYFRSGRGQRSGGWNVPVNTFQDQPFRPEELTDYELGFKSELLGGAWTTNGDVFYGNYDDMQRLLPRLVGETPTTYVINAGRARVSGAELESALHLSRLWFGQLSFGWTDARYRQFLYSGTPGAPAADLTSNAFYQTPKFNAGLGLGSDLAAGSGQVHLRADYSWQDSVQFNLINDFNRQGAYGTLNARVAYSFEAQAQWELAIFGTNLTNREYAITGGSVASAAPPISAPPAMAWQIPGAPRMYGIGLRVRFGATR